MEHAAAWRPSEFQLASWSSEEPAAGLPLPVDYVSIDIFGTCCGHQAYVPASSGGLQLVESNYSAASSRHNWSPQAIVVDGQNRQEVADPWNGGPRNSVSNYSDVRHVFDEVENAFNVDMSLTKVKMHRYPAGFRGTIDKRYRVPRIVAIGPYHHHKSHLKPAERVKHMAAIRCVKESTHLLEEMYAAVDSVAKDYAFRLYDKDFMALKGINYEYFRDMMFVDACFLVQYMRMQCGIPIDQSLASFLRSNGRDIRHDIILLENQLPWKVVETVMNFVTEPEPVPLDSFISVWKGYLQHHKQEPKKEKEDTYVSTLVKNKRFKPHLLGLLRYYTVGSSGGNKSGDREREPKNRSFSISAIELAQIGISLTPSKTMDLIDMSLNQEGSLFAELSLAPLSLDLNRATYLFNMAALELCTVKGFADAEVEDSAVCSYLLLLALLVCREEDVQELRARGLLQGGGGLTDNEAFRFFTSFQSLRVGICYNRVMADIEIYKESMWKEAKLYSFFYKNWKTIGTVAGVVAALIGIIGTLVSIKQSI